MFKFELSSKLNCRAKLDIKDYPRGETREKIGVVNSKYGIFRQKIPNIPKNSKNSTKIPKNSINSKNSISIPF
jgi:hypothetical protein